MNNIQIFAAGVFWGGLVVLALLAFIVWIDSRKGKGK